MKKLQEEFKVINVRVQKWRQMLQDDTFKNLALTKKRVRKGIPPGIRQKAWPRLINLERFKTQTGQSYDQLIRQRSIIEGEIRLDIPRTFTQEKAELMRASLFNVLKALSLVYHQLGYCQGMNHLSMKLLETLNDQTVFWMMNYIIRTYSNIMSNYKNPSTTELQNYVLQQLMCKYTPKMRAKLQQQSIQLTAFTPRWFITLFSSTLPTQLFYRIFQCFLVQGYVIIYKAALTMIKLNQSFVISSPFQQAIGHLMGKSQYQNINFDEFCETMHSFSFSVEDTEQLQQKFKRQNPQRIYEWQMQSQQYYQKRLNNNRQKQQRVQSCPIQYFDIKAFMKIPFQLYEFD